MNEIQEQKNGFRLSPLQKHLWSAGGGVHRQVSFCLEVAGLDLQQCQTLCARIIGEQEILRTSFPRKGSDFLPIQLIGEHIPHWAPPQLVDDEAFLVELLELLMAGDAPLNSEAGPVVHIQPVIHTGNNIWLVIHLFELAADPTTPELFAAKLLAASLAPAVEPAQDEEPMQYVDFSEWMHDCQDEERANSANFWTSVDLASAHQYRLPFQHRNSRPETRKRWLVPHQSDASFADARNRSLVCWAWMLQRLCGVQDLMVGCYFSGRQVNELSDVLGLVGTYLPIHPVPSRNKTVAQAMAELSLSLQEASPLQFTWFHDLLKNPGNLHYGFAAIEAALHTGNGVSTRVSCRHILGEQLELCLNLIADKAGATLELIYDTGAFDEAYIARLAHRLGLLLDQVSKDPHQMLAHFDCTTADERARLMVCFNESQLQDSDLGTTCLHTLIEKQAEIMPEAPAVFYEGTLLSYGELNSRANRLAHLLIEKGLHVEERVAVSLVRSVEMLVATLAVLKAGGAYLPMEPQYPAQRMAFMIEDSQARYMLINGHHEAFPNPVLGENTHHFERLSIDLIDMDEINLEDYPDNNPNRTLVPQNLAYVIYTSGSTGKPKGVQVNHASPINLLRGLEQRVYGALACTRLRVTMNAPLSFDASMQQIVMLTAGHCLYIIPEEVRMDGMAFINFLDQHRLDALDCTPTHLAMIVGAGLLESRGHLPKLVLVAGGAIDQTLWNRLAQAPRTRFFNIYGPTECTVDATGGAIETPGIAPSIGPPLANYRIYLGDSRLQSIPAGVSGQLCIGGPGLARGYQALPALTAEKFVPCPFSNEPGARLYQSGDLARFMADDRLEFVGRIDDQVKIRGFRIELGEVEQTIQDYKDVNQVVVLAREVKPGDTRLVAYVQARAEQTLVLADFNHYLLEKLPDYMIPSAIVVMQHWPLTSNGKLDRKALPLPGEAKSDRPYEAPQTPLEKAVVTIFAEVLEVERVGVSDHYFELGGHSLSATRVVSRVRDVIGIELPLKDLFMNPTVRDLVGVIEERRGQQTAGLPRPTRFLGNAPLPLSFSQERLWLLDRLQPGNSAYNLSITLRLRGHLNRDALRQSLDALVARHASLRTLFPPTDGKPEQVVNPVGPAPITLVDLSTIDEDDLEEKLRTSGLEELGKSFDLGKGPLFRSVVYQLGNDDHQLLLLFHHIVSDGWSSGILLREFNQLYCAFVQGEETALPVLPLSYGDYALWQRGLVGSQAMLKQMTYWKKQLASVPSVLNLPTDYPRPAHFQFRGENHFFRLSRQILSNAKHLLRAESATPFMLFHSAFSLILSRYSGQDDIWIGSPNAGRSHQELEGIIGLFMSTLVLRTRTNGQPDARELLKRVRDVVLDAQANPDIPFEHLVEVLNPERNLGINPLFQVMFTYQNLPLPEFNLPQLEVTPIPLANDSAKFDLILDLTEIPGDDELWGRIEFNTDIFNRAMAERLEGHFRCALTAMISNPDQPINRLQILTQEEQNNVLVTWNQTRADFSSELCIHHLFESSAARSGDADAIIAQNGIQTYAQVNAHANRVAHYLLSKGIGRGDLVAICFERKTELAAGLLGILKTGAAYVPMDPSYPLERMHYILTDIEARFCLAHKSILERLGQVDCTCVAIDEDDFGGYPETNPTVDVSAIDLSYIIFTSGSTGRPKGVILQHRPVVNLIEWVNHTYSINAQDRLLFVTSLCFDLSVYDVFGTLAAGASIYVASDEVLADAQLLAQTLHEQDITFWDSAPAALLQTVPFLPELGQGNPKLRLCFLSGDWIPLSLPPAMQGVFTNVKIIALGGATEAAIWSNFFTVDQIQPHWKSVPYGKPLQNARYYVLSHHLELCAVNVAGDLYIGDGCLSRGYFKQAALTAQRYLPDPFAKEPGDILYCTGDRARRMPDGNIEFLGRLDAQVKIRGYRIELGEIESVLTEHEDVREAVVLVREDRPGDRRLVAYVLATSPSEAPRTDSLKALLGSRLPEYMMPAALVSMNSWPLTSNGKLDRKALPKPELPSGASMEETLPQERSPIQEMMMGIWSQVLGLASFDLEEDFFSLGGHSLSATQLVSRIRGHFGVSLALRDLFEHPYLLAQTALVEKVRLAKSPLTIPFEILQDRRNTPLSFAQERLWIISRMGHVGSAYNIPGAFRLEGNLDWAAMEAAFRKMIGRHEALRTSFPDVNGDPVQAISQDVNGFTLGQEDLRTIDPGHLEEEIQRRVQEHALRLFDLQKGPLIFADILNCPGNVHVLLLNIHHIISDGWSMGVLVRELTALYDAELENKVADLAPLSIQYPDFAAWQRKHLAEGRYNDQLAYWKGVLADEPDPLNLPLYQARPAVFQYRGSEFLYQLPAHLAHEINRLARATGSTLFMVLLAGFKALLARYTGQVDLAIGTPVANRGQEALEPLIGLFINTLVLRTQMDGNPSAKEAINRVRATSLAAYDNQDLPFDKLVSELNPNRDRGRTPYFQVMFILQNAPLPQLKLTGLTWTEIEVTRPTTQFDLIFNARQVAEGLAIRVHYNSDIFQESTVAELCTHFETLLAGMCEESERPLFSLPMLSEDERKRAIMAYNNTTVDYPRDLSIQACFEAVVVANPEKTAITSGQTSLTYDALNRRSNQLAHHLRDLGVRPGDMVAFSLDRSLEVVVVMLAIIKCDAAYVPLDPAYPEERLAFMINDVAPVALLTIKENLKDMPTEELSKIPIILLNEHAQQIQTKADTNPPVFAGGNMIAMIIYTSGSTGQPKGILVPHYAIMRLLFSIDYAHLGPDVTILHMAATAFDAAIWEIWGALLHGAHCVIYTDRLPSPESLAKVIQEQGVDSVFLTTSVFNLMVEEIPQALSCLKQLLTGGESPSYNHFRKALKAMPNTQLIHVYGPTESTTYAHVCTIPSSWADTAAPLNVGLPISNTTGYVLDRYMNLLPHSATGELFLGGDGLTLGYHRRARLTAERFVPNSFSTVPGQRLYKTGDLSRRAANGEMIIAGRVDFQVKIRGFRIEPEEIEKILSSHPQVRDAVVLVQGSGEQKHLVAFALPEGDTALTMTLMSDYLKDNLPEYMVPSAYVILDKFPLNPNGKVDRKALHAIEVKYLADETPYQGPRNETEEKLVTIWQSLLDGRVGVFDNFFELGGHSLTASRATAQIKDTFGVDLPLGDFFSAQTIDQLAPIVESLLLEGVDDQEVSNLMAEMEGLSEEEILAMLSDEDGL